MLLWESNATADPTGGRVQAVKQVMESGCKYRWLLARSPAHCSPPTVGPGSQQARDQHHGLRVGKPCLKEAEWWDVRLAHRCWPVGGSHEPRSAGGVHELVMVSQSFSEMSQPCLQATEAYF